MEASTGRECDTEAISAILNMVGEPGGKTVQVFADASSYPFEYEMHAELMPGDIAPAAGDIVNLEATRFCGYVHQRVIHYAEDGGKLVLLLCKPLKARQK